MTGLRELRPHQVSALDGLKWSLVEGKRRPLLQAVTGFGKTVLAAHIVEGARRKGRRVCFCVPSITLVDQTFERFRENGIDPAEMGIIQASHPWRRPHAPIQIATAQTLARRDRPEVDVVVLDEAHIRFGVYERWMADCGYPVKPGETALPGSPAERGKAPIFIGLTATPWAKGLGLLFDGLIKSSSLAEMIEGGYLSPFRVFAPSHPDLTGVKTVAGDYHEGQLSERMSKATLVANVVSTWMAKASDRPTLCFAVDRAHARALHEEFTRAGVPAAYVDAETSREERAEIGAALARGEIKVAVNIGTLTTGVDWDVRCISLCRPTKSESLFVQIIGRGLRTADGKSDCLARGTLVLTDDGEIPIEQVTLSHRVWDGENFVEHRGAVCRGVRPTIEHDGIVGTPDHEVMTDAGWETLADAARDGRRIARTGFGRTPVRLVADRVSGGFWRKLAIACRSRVCALFSEAYGALPQPAEASGNYCMSVMQSTSAGYCSEVAISEMSKSVGPLREPEKRQVRGLWWPWHLLQVRERASCGSLGGGQSRHFLSSDAAGSSGQQRSLRAWEPSLGHPGSEYEQHEKVGRIRSTKIRGVSEVLSGRKVCRCDTQQIARDHDGCGSRREMAAPVAQTEREVWDILNAGPLQRFTANGRLVHNCLILDHSSTHQRLGFVTDIDRHELDDGTKAAGEVRKDERTEPLPWECPGCNAVVPARLGVCCECGHVRKKPPNVSYLDGELEELRRDGSRVKSLPVKQQLADMGKDSVYAQLQWVRQDRGRAEGWVGHAYKEIFGVWPRSLPKDVEERPSGLLLSWLRSRDIAYARGMKRRQMEMGNA